jgi:serine/threonine-protein kinase
MTSWSAGSLKSAASGLTGWKRIAAHVVLAGATAGVFGLAVWLTFDKIVMPRVVGRGAPLTSVPSVVGKTPDEARQILTAAGLEPVLDPELKRSERIEKGLVALQTPQAGQGVKTGHSVRFWTSAGHVSIAVPDVKGQDSAVAARAIEEAGLALDEADHQIDSVTEAGKVLRTNPVAGASLVPGAKIHLIVSLGRDTAAKVDTTKSRGLF